MKYADGSVYKGEIEEEKRHGKGRLTFEDQTFLDGYFSNNRFVGDNVGYVEPAKSKYAMNL